MGAQILGLAPQVQGIAATFGDALKSSIGSSIFQLRRDDLKGRAIRVSEMRTERFVSLDNRLDRLRNAATSEFTIEGAALPADRIGRSPEADQ